jgi:hypothetical protein
VSNGAKTNRAAGSAGDSSPASPADASERYEIAREIFIRKIVSADSIQRTPEHIAEQALAAADAFLATAKGV